MTTTTFEAGSPATALETIRLALPVSRDTVDQDSEWFLYDAGGGWREARAHDYTQIYSVPGLYERIFTDLLECRSPAVVVELLAGELRRAGADASALTALDLGAGNGQVAEELSRVGVPTVVAVDLLPEAAEAAQRDRPGLYADYVVGDITDLSPRARRRLEAHRFSAMTCVAALGFGDIPPQAFASALSMIQPGGWVAFNLNTRFLVPGDRSGLADLIAHMTDTAELRVVRSLCYVHRLSTSGQPIQYAAIVARKPES